MAASDFDVDDIKLYLNQDEIERLLYLLDNAPDRSPVDRRLVRIITTQLGKHLDMRGGLNKGKEKL